MYDCMYIYDINVCTIYAKILASERFHTLLIFQVKKLYSFHYLNFIMTFYMRIICNYESTSTKIGEKLNAVKYFVAKLRYIDAVPKISDMPGLDFNIEIPHCYTSRSTCTKCITFQ